MGKMIFLFILFFSCKNQVVIERPLPKMNGKNSNETVNKNLNTNTENQVGSSAANKNTNLNNNNSSENTVSNGSVNTLNISTTSDSGGRNTTTTIGNPNLVNTILGSWGCIAASGVGTSQVTQATLSFDKNILTIVKNEMVNGLLVGESSSHKYMIDNTNLVLTPQSSTCSKRSQAPQKVYVTLNENTLKLSPDPTTSPDVALYAYGCNALGKGYVAQNTKAQQMGCVDYENGRVIFNLSHSP